MSNIIVSFGADHAGYEMKQKLISYAKQLGYEIIDHGCHDNTPVDYPDCVPPVINDVLQNRADFGVLICGSGIGVDIAANRHPGIRSALCNCGLSAQMARRHNNANVLSLASRFIGLEVAQECLQRFLTTEFEASGRHERRVQKLG